MALLSESERAKILNSYSDEQLEALLYDWNFWARPSQKMPDWEWHVWLLLAGRGFGKTRVGAEMVYEWVRNGVERIALVAQTPGEARDVMIDGESGLMNIGHPSERPIYYGTSRRLVFPNGSYATIYSGENPGLLRGPQHEKAWVDELAKYRYADEVWDNLMMGLRLGDNPQVIVTTTPKPTKLIKTLVKSKDNHITRGSTYDNASNLPKKFIDGIISKYENTRLGRQELYAEILDDNPNALWTSDMINDSRVTQHPVLKRIVVAIDPSATSGEESDEAGVITAGYGEDGHFYVLSDDSMRASPLEWAKAGVTMYHKYNADRIVGESNNGGDMIEIIIRSIDKNVSYKSVHASRGKYVRAEPVSALYEQGKVHHVGYFAELEDELTQWEQGDKSPNRLDALVWAITELQGKSNMKWGW